jgi:hypothetical protein
MTGFQSRRAILTQAAILPLVGMTAKPSFAQPADAPTGMSLSEKSAKRQATDEQIRATGADDKSAQAIIIDDFFRADYKATPAGKYLNADKLFLRWAKPDWFEYVPDPQNQLAFVRASGEIITPGRMYTDGGSIPRWFWAQKNLSPWVYVPAYLVHDWEFDRHRQKASTKTFEAVRDTLAEGLKTLMEEGLAPRDEKTFRSIYAGVSSFIAMKLWES